MDYDEIKEKMAKAIEVLNERLAEIRAGRANPAILNKVSVEYNVSLKRIIMKTM